MSRRMGSYLVWRSLEWHRLGPWSAPGKGKAEGTEQAAASGTAESLRKDDPGAWSAASWRPYFVVPLVAT